MCLLGCLFCGREYLLFNDELEQFKRRHLPHTPDEPVILHREDIINRRHAFWRLRDSGVARAFDEELLDLIGRAQFRVVAMVIDKHLLTEKYFTPAHPYHLALGFMLQRYCGYLNHISRRGDVMAESRGAREDRQLQDSYARYYERGAWRVKPDVFQRALTTKKLKLKSKSANIAGLQLADLLGHPVRQSILVEKGMIDRPVGPFGAKLLERVDNKFNRHLYNGRIWGYGKVLFPT